MLGGSFPIPLIEEVRDKGRMTTKKADYDAMLIAVFGEDSFYTKHVLVDNLPVTEQRLHTSKAIRRLLYNCYYFGYDFFIAACYELLFLLED